MTGSNTRWDLSIFSIFLFLSSRKVNNGGSWICIRNDSNQVSMAWIASHGNHSLNPKRSLKLYPSIWCSSIFLVFVIFRKMRNWFSFASCLFVFFYLILHVPLISLSFCWIWSWFGHNLSLGCSCKSCRFWWCQKEYFDNECHHEKGGEYGSSRFW